MTITENMKPSPYHKIFSSKRPYDLRVENRDVFSEEEREILLKYGFWMEALERKRIDPETKEQHEFLEFCQGNLDPRNIFERAWYNLKQQRRFENPSASATYKQFRNVLINPAGNPDDWWSNPNR